MISMIRSALVAALMAVGTRLTMELKDPVREEDMDTKSVMVP